MSWAAPPIHFRNRRAARQAARAYQKEEGEFWFVVYLGVGKDKYYRPCRARDYVEASKLGWRAYVPQPRKKKES